MTFGQKMGQNPYYFGFLFLTTLTSDIQLVIAARDIFTECKFRGPSGSRVIDQSFKNFFEIWMGSPPDTLQTFKQLP